MSFKRNIAVFVVFNFKNIFLYDIVICIIYNSACLIAEFVVCAFVCNIKFGIINGFAFGVCPTVFCCLEIFFG